MCCCWCSLTQRHPGFPKAVNGVGKHALWVSGLLFQRGIWWASACNNCERELPIDIHTAKLASSNLTILLINCYIYRWLHGQDASRLHTKPETVWLMYRGSRMGNSNHLEVRSLSWSTGRDWNYEVQLDMNQSPPKNINRQGMPSPFLHMTWLDTKPTIILTPLHFFLNQYEGICYYLCVGCKLGSGRSCGGRTGVGGPGYCLLFRYI